MADVTEVLLPSMGEGITEATLVKWLKNTGEAVSKDDPLLEVSTDKVDTEIPAPADGFLVSTLVGEGDTVEINSVIAHIGATADAKAPANGSAPKAAAKSAAASSNEASPSATPSATTTVAAPVSDATLSSGPVRSSPVVRKMARDKGVDLSLVPGSGLHGRITKRDMESFLASGGASAQRPAAGAAPVARAMPGAAHLEYGQLQTKTVDGQELLDGVVVRREKMSKMRGLIAEHMVRSVRTSPHVTTVFEIDLHNVVQHRERHKRNFKAKYGFNLTYTAYFIQAAVEALKQHPICNVSVDGEDILWKDEINIGCAVAIESGLIVPVIRNAGGLNLLGIAQGLNDIVTRARSKKLTPADTQGGTFSVTNPGMYGSLISAPIINQPQVAIMNIGAIIKRPVVVDDLIGVRPLVQIGLTFDHRVVDGEGGAKFLATLKEFLENFPDIDL